MIDYTKILTTKFFGKEWILNGDDYEGLVWLSKTPKPSKAELDGYWDEVQELIENEVKEKAAKKQAILDRIGLTADELKTILG